MSVGKILLEIENITKEDTYKYQEILSALVHVGALGLKGGKAVLHFDAEGNFMGIQLDYWAFKRKKDDSRNNRGGGNW